MLKPRLLLFLLIAIIFYSCKTDNKYNYAIKDFGNALKPHLTKIVSKGVVMYYDSALRNIASEKDLNQLSLSEHPVLRASAFRERLHRTPLNNFDILMSHLDDTAIVATDGGEFGIFSRKVSDDILQEANWNTNEEKNKTIDKVITQNNYLRSAYLIIKEIEPQEKYYKYIKDMATRPRRLSYDGYEMGFGDIEFALYGLAKFKKREDVKIIKSRLMDEVWQLSHISFELMTNFPDTSYFDILQTYHRRQFYKFSGNRRDGFSGYVADRADPEDFIKALVIQQNEKSAKLLDTILNKLPLKTFMPDKESIIDNIIMEIWEHPCPAYAKLRDKINFKAKEMLKRRIYLPMEESNLQIDTTKPRIRW
jgi:hypothetical protein